MFVGTSGARARTCSDRSEVSFLPSVVMWRSSWDQSWWQHLSLGIVGVILNRKRRNCLKIPLLKCELLSVLALRLLCFTWHSCNFPLLLFIYFFLNWNWKCFLQIQSYSCHSHHVVRVTPAFQLSRWTPVMRFVCVLQKCGVPPSAAQTACCPVVNRCLFGVMEKN